MLISRLITDQEFVALAMSLAAASSGKLRHYAEPTPIRNRLLPEFQMGALRD